MSLPGKKERAKEASTRSPVRPNADLPSITAVSDPAPEVKNEPTNAEPLAPPPRPAVAVSAPDYFSQNHALNIETNPFDFSFAGGQAALGSGLTTPGGSKLLPSVASLTSGSFWGVNGGLRTGPLSPAMLPGPTKEDDYFGNNHMRGGFPTPNESGMRSGLTPGGSGSMFAEPSPSTTSYLDRLIGSGQGLTTPGAAEFARSAIAAAAERRTRPNGVNLPNITSQPVDPMMTMDVKPPQLPGNFDETNDAANGLFMLAQQSNGPQQTNPYTVAPQAVVQIQQLGQQQEPSPHMAHRNGGSISTQSGREMSGGLSEEEHSNKPKTRTKGKRSAPETPANGNGRRKGNDQPARAPVTKKSKANNGNPVDMDQLSEEELDMNKEEYHANGKKMTDDEKRKNFLERNRIAALKCRQRKKQWLANLQHKVEMYAAENENLTHCIQGLREELLNLKTLLTAHKDCSVSHSQGLSNGGIQQLVDSGFGNSHLHPYGIGPLNNSQQQQQQQPQQQLMANQAYQQRRES
ncbi:hypothetical protein B2J93_3928 [Marssonina coronariae]|uniref:BZIP domain-containing protein n=1 Tax=Diplocarpon coronariae TaxID=2795749 RepID=A0A218YXH0_9HELO|nr:hypothetical protein B2J93_3928 [Marssonina coronariae]